MRRIAILFGLVLLGGGFVPIARATSYYVSSSAGNDSNSGTTSASPWRTLAQVNSYGSFAAGDIIYLKRGDTWNEQLIPPSSGTGGSPISFDAYGSGSAPVITAAAPTTFVSGSWTYVSGGAWKATIASTIASGTVNLVQFGKLYGRKQASGGNCATAVTSKYDWCIVWPALYVYSPSGTNPVTTYATDGSIVPIVSQPAGLQLIYVNGKSWLTFQHIKLQNFDYMGVGVAGASDNLVFANMESDGIVPLGTTPHGFYVNASNPTNIQFLNDDAHLNYDGFRFDGTATAITVTNCRGYANRDAGLKDNTGHATYSYSHFYGNNIAQLIPGDIVGGIAGSGNILSSIAPVVNNFNTYPARFSFTVDDVGSSPGTETYVNSFLTMFSSRSLKFNAAVVPSYPVDWTSVKNWFSAGNEIDSHSWSHQYYSTNTNPQGSPPYPNAPALDIQYAGSGTAATLSISGNALSTTVTGASSDNLSVDLTASPYNTMAGLATYLISVPHYNVVYDPGVKPLPGSSEIGPLVRPNTKSVNLLNVLNQDIKSAVFVLVYDQSKLEPDEMASSKTALQANVPGLTENFYVYPAGIEDPSIEAYAVAAGYAAARGSLSMKDQNNSTVGANSVYSNGVNVQDITSLGAIGFHGMTEPEIDSLAATLVFRASAWGAPYGLFTHYNSRSDNTPDISNTELGQILDSIIAHGGVLLTNAALASALTSGTSLSGTTRWMQSPTGSAADMGVATAGSPTVAVGVSTAYPIDINGVTRTFFGAWDIGASAYASQRYGTGTGSGHWTMGSPVTGPFTSSAYTGTDPIQWPSPIPNIGGLTNNGAQVTDTSYPSGTPATLIRCTDANTGAAFGYNNAGYSAGLGGSADVALFDSSSSMLHVNLTSGNTGMLLMNPLTGVCAPSLLTRANDLTNPGPAGSFYAFGGGSFSLTTPGKWISAGQTTDSGSGTEVDAYTINSSTGNFTHAAIADLKYGLPIGANVSAWAPNTAYDLGDYVSFSPAVPAYAASTAYALGDIVVPATGCAVKVTQGGTTGSSAPNWNSICTPYVSTNSVTDGTVRWKGIGGAASFIFQNISGNGTSSSSAPTFLNLATATTQMPQGHPDIISTVSDNGITWENVGPNVPPTWMTWGGSGTNDTLLTAGLSSNTYGNSGNYNNFNGNQNTGVWLVQYNASLNIYHLYNTATLMFTDYSCGGGGTGYNCAGGTNTPLWTATDVGTATGITGCAQYIHNVKATYGNYAILVPQGFISGTCYAGSSAGFMVWRATQTPFNGATQMQLIPFPPNHWSVLHDHLFSNAVSNYGFSAGVYGSMLPLATPSVTAPVNWLANPCTANGSSSYPTPDCDMPAAIDSHLSGVFNPGLADISPVLGTSFNIASVSPVEFSAYQGEVIGVSTTPTTTSPTAGPLVGANVWRFAHTFATGSNSAFDAQFQISQASQDGKFVAFTTDWDGQLGSTDGIAPTVANGELAVNPPSGVTYSCMGAPVWLPNTAYLTGQLVGPIGGTGGSGPVYHVYQATAGGTSGSSAPAWSTSTSIGTTVSDGTVTWNDRGPGDCRSDVVIAKLPSPSLIGVTTDFSSLAEEAAWQGKTNGVAQFYWNMDHSNYAAITSGLNSAWSAQVVPVFTLQLTQDGVSWQSSSSVNALYGGGNSTYNGYLSGMGTTLLNWVCPGDGTHSPGACGLATDRRFYLRLAHEMNGDWYPWSETSGGIGGSNASGSYVAAWQNIHSILAGLGLDSNHVQWIWTVNASDSGGNTCSKSPAYACIQHYYPGDVYVDWVSIDGYNFCSDDPVTKTPATVFGQQLANFAVVAPAKAIAINEYGFQMSCSPTRTDSVPDMNAWIEAAMTYFLSNRVKMAVYYNSSGGNYRVFSTAQTWYDETYDTSHAISGYRIGVGSSGWTGANASNPQLLTTAQFKGQ